MDQILSICLSEDKKAETKILLYDTDFQKHNHIKMCPPTIAEALQLPRLHIPCISYQIGIVCTILA